MIELPARDVFGLIRMCTTGSVGHEPPADSIVTPLRYGGKDGPEAIVIGPTHPPYYVFPDGRTEWASAEAEQGA